MSNRPDDAAAVVAAMHDVTSGLQQALGGFSKIAVIIGPLFAHSVGVVGAAARQRGVPVVAFSTDASVAARGVLPFVATQPRGPVYTHDASPAWG